jgi:hypothetical protein
MKLKSVRRAALVVAVLSAVGVIAATAGASPGTPDSAALAAGPSVGATAGVSGPSGPTDGSGVTGPSGPTDGSSATGPSGPSGTTEATAPSAPAGPTGSTGTDAGTQQPPVTIPAAGVSGPSGATGSTVNTRGDGAPLPGSSGTGHRHHRHRRHHHHKTTVTPAIVPASSQPLSASGSAHNQASGQGSVRSGPAAPSPSLFAGANPLAGVLPGSWEDPFIVNGAADVPQFYVDSFHVPPFLLSIYQAAGAAYGIPWQTLAAINEVETDYGTNLDVSSAGAIGWMQFLPSTWRRYGLDASASGSRDPYNAADAIFSAARYLAAAGGTHNLPRAIYAYNHSRAYVQSVLDRAELLSAEPQALVGPLTELSEGDFPIQLRYHASYRPASDPAASPSGSTGAADAAGASPAPAPGAVGAAAATGVQRAPAAAIYAGSGAAVVSAQDGTIVAIGHSRKLGRFVVVRNAFGDRFTYANLASVSAWHPSPRPPARSAAILSAAVPSALAPGPSPTAPASAGAQRAGATPNKAAFLTQRHATRRHAAAAQAPLVVTINLRSTPSAATLFTPLAVLERAAAPAPHKTRRIHRAALMARYFTGAFGLRASQLELTPMRVGSHVLAGTILGRLAHVNGKRRPHLLFELRPAGSSQPLIDPRPFLDSWSQLETLELHRNSFGATPYFGPNLHARNVGGVLLTSQVDIERIVLGDRRVTLPACERSAIAEGSVDRRVLATLEVLVLHGIDPVVSGAWCSHDAHTRRAAPSLLKTGNAIAVTSLDGRAAVGAVAAVATHALNTLRGAARPALSAHTVSGQLVIAFAPAHEPQALAAAASFTSGFALSAPRWSQLDVRLAAIREPRVPTAVSRAALAAHARRHSASS